VLINSQENLMNISDLNQFDVVEGNEVVGGGKSYYKGYGKYYKKPTINVAVAKADAGAFGKNTLAVTKTDSFVDEGFASIASSESIAVAVGSKKKYKKY